MHGAALHLTKARYIHSRTDLILPKFPDGDAELYERNEKSETNINLHLFRKIFTRSMKIGYFR